MRIAVTGSSGFIGSHLVKRLEELGADIIHIDVESGIDITDWQQLESIEPFDAMFHLAAKSYVPHSYEHPRDFFYSNITGTMNVLELCRIHKSRMIFISSYIYGVPRYLPIDENHPTAAFNPYAQTKIIGEQLCESYHRDFDVPIVILRPFNIYGKGQNENFLIPTIIKQAKTGKITLKDPEPRRDMIYIDDLINLLAKVINYNQTNYEVFNVGTGESHSVREITQIINELLDNRIDVEFDGQQRKIEIMDTVADISKAKKLLTWFPKVTIREGLQRLLLKRYNKCGIL